MRVGINELNELFLHWRLLNHAGIDEKQTLSFNWPNHLDQSVTISLSIGRAQPLLKEVSSLAVEPLSNDTLFKVFLSKVSTFRLAFLSSSNSLRRVSWPYRISQDNLL